MSVDSLKDKRHLYYELLSDIRNTITYLKKSSSSVSSATALKNYYTIDDQPTSKTKDIEDIKNETDKIIDHLNNDVIPWIERKIKSLGNQIEEAIKEESS